MNESPLLAQLFLYQQAIFITKYEKGNATVTHPVSVHDLAAIFTKIPLSSGFLPPHALFWGKQANRTRIGIYIEAQIQTLQSKDRAYVLPLPPTVFVGDGNKYYIYAVKERPVNPRCALYNYPSPNIYMTGEICKGNTPFPDCSTDSIQNAYQAFIESGFNPDLQTRKSKRHPKDVLSFWQEIEGQATYPLADLIRSTITLKDFIEHVP